MFKGNIDIATNEMLAGWIANIAEPHNSVKITVYINNTFCLDCICDMYRNDVFEAIGSGGHGFSFTLEPFLTPGKNTVHVVAENTGFTFENSEFILHHAKNSELVEVGTNDWLFLKNDSNEVNKIIQGELPLSPEMTLHLKRTFIYRKVISKYYGAQFLQVIIPEKNIVCNQQKTTPLTISNDRPSIQIIKELEKQSEWETFYPIKDFTKYPNTLDLYYKTDTHLSSVGQVFLMDLILKKLKLTPKYEYESSIDAFVGDLGSKMTPAISEKTTYLSITPKPDYLVDKVTSALEGGGHLTGSLLYSSRKHTGDGKLYVYGTSGAYYIRDFLCAQFDEVIFTWGNSMDSDLIRTFKPNYVLGILTERFLNGPPADLNTETNLDLIKSQAALCPLNIARDSGNI